MRSNVPIYLFSFFVFSGTRERRGSGAGSVRSGAGTMERDVGRFCVREIRFLLFCLFCEGNPM